MFGPLGFPELLFILALALLIFGPKKLPQVGRTLGRGMAEFRKASNDLRRTINAEMVEQELRENDPRKVVRDSLRDIKQELTGAGSEDAGSSDAGSKGAAPQAGDAAGSDPSPKGGPAPEPATGGRDSAATDEGAAAEADELGAEGTVARGSSPDAAGGEPTR